MSELFENWNLKKQIKHIRKCQREGLEFIKSGEPSNLADIADHLDTWGPWLCDKVEKLQHENEKLKADLEYLLSGEDDSCSFDHNGNCQNHFYFNYDGSCRIRDIRKALEASSHE